MLWSRGLAVWLLALAVCAGVVGWSLPGAPDGPEARGDVPPIMDEVARSDDGAISDEPPPFGGRYDRRGAVNAAAHVFIGQVVGEALVCRGASGPDHVFVDSAYSVKVERNLKGRLQGTVAVLQPTTDTAGYGPDGKLTVGGKYLLIAWYSARDEAYRLVDHTLGYALIDEPGERAALTAEVRRYLDDPYTPTATADDETRATWDAQSTVSATMFGLDQPPTPYACPDWAVAYATEAADELARENRAIGPIFRPDFELVTPTPTATRSLPATPTP